MLRYLEDESVAVVIHGMCSQDLYVRSIQAYTEGGIAYAEGGCTDFSHLDLPASLPPSFLACLRFASGPLVCRLGHLGWKGWRHDARLEAVLFDVKGGADAPSHSGRGLGRRVRTLILSSVPALSLWTASYP